MFKFSTNEHFLSIYSHSLVLSLHFRLFHSFSHSQVFVLFPSFGYDFLRMQNDVKSRYYKMRKRLAVRFDVCVPMRVLCI